MLTMLSVLTVLVVLWEGERGGVTGSSTAPAAWRASRIIAWHTRDCAYLRSQYMCQARQDKDEMQVFWKKLRVVKRSKD